MDPHRQFFSRWARFYERTPLLARLLREQQDFALERLTALPGERVLDLGCGPGRAVCLLRGRGVIAVGADAQREMLTREFTSAQALAGALPFRTGAFNGVICSNSFHHYPEPLATLREVRRVLAPGARAVFVDPNLEHPLARLTIYGGEALAFGMAVHLHSPHEWIALGESAGFARVQVEPIGRFPFGSVSLLIELKA